MAALLLLGLLAGGCGDDKISNIVWDKSPRGDTGAGPFVTTGPLPSADTYFRLRVPTSGASVLMVGRLGVAEGYAARPFIRFASLPDTGTVDPDSVLSATLVVQGRDRYGAEPVTLQLFAPAAQWTADSLAYDDGDDPAFLGELSPGDVAGVDTTRFTAAVPTSVIAAWLRRPSENFGLFLDTPESATDALIRLFSKEVNPGERTPSLTIRYQDDGAVDSVVVVASEDATALLLPSFPPAGGEPWLRIANAQAFRALVRFDPDSLRALVPRGGTVNRARLVFDVVDTSLVIASVPFALYAVTSEWVEGTADSTITAESSPSATATYTAGADTVAFDIAALLQRWIDAKTENHGLVIRSTNEPNDLATILLGSREADPALRPRLDLIYSLPPGPRP